jgi:amino acid permease
MQPAVNASWTAADIDIKSFFDGMIRPNFQSEEARTACGSPGPDHNALNTPLMKARDQIRQTSDNENAMVNNTFAVDGEQRPSCWKRWFQPLKEGSIRSCSFVLVATSLGTGFLCIPKAFSDVGLGLGLVNMIFAAVVSALSQQIVMIAARYTGSHSYSSVVVLASQQPWTLLAVDVVTLLMGIGAVGCLFIFEGDFVPAVFVSPPWGLPGIVFGREVAIVAVAAAVWPLALATELSALHYLSVAKPAVVFITIIVVAVQAPAHHAKLADTGGTIKMWDFQMGTWLQSISTMIFAFMNHQNVVPAGNLISRPSIRRIVKSTVNANLIVWILLALVGVVGYLSFGSGTKGNFLVNYGTGPGQPSIWCCRVLMGLGVFFVIPVALLPVTRSLGQLLQKARGDINANRPISPTMHKACATALLVCITCLGVAVSKVEVLVNIVGGLFATALMFWFPAIIFWRLLWPMQPRCARVVVIVLFVFLGTCGLSSVVVGVSNLSKDLSKAS